MVTFPVIMKTLEGTKGVGVLFVNLIIKVDIFIQLLYSQNENIDLLLQEFLEMDFDIKSYCG